MSGKMTPREWYLAPHSPMLHRLGGIYDDQQAFHRTEMVRAIVEAMREPSDEMINAASGCLADYNDFSNNCVTNYTTRQIWQAMIDKLLETPK